MYICMTHAYFVPRENKRVPDPLELESKIALSYYVSDGNRTHVLWKSSQCF